MQLADSLIERVDCRFGERREALRGIRLFITGGTGFFGRWLLEYLAYANDQHGLGLCATVLTRDRTTFARTHHDVAHLLGHPAINFTEGDVRSFAFPAGCYTHVIHGAHTTAHATFNSEDPLVQFDTACLGARRVLDFSVQTGVRRFLMLSSGSVYGPPPNKLLHIPESFTGAPLPQNVDAALNHGKRVAEFQCAYYMQRFGIETVIARCFSFIGPGLPLDIHYAAGNFIHDALWSEAIVVKSDGSPIRSYMDIGDLLVWLLALLTQGPTGEVYNVGSDEQITIMDLAMKVRDLLAPHKPIRLSNKQDIRTGCNVYVPDIAHARNDLNLDVWTSLDDSIKMTAKYELIRKGHLHSTRSVDPTS